MDSAEPWNTALLVWALEWLWRDFTLFTWITVPPFFPVSMSWDQAWWTLKNPFCFSSDYQCQAGSSLIDIKGYEIKSFKVQRNLFASLILLWILQVCCGICPPMTSWRTCWLEKPCRHWLKLSSSPTQAGQTEITQNQVLYLTLISSTMPQDAWGEHSVYNYPKQ